MRSIALFSILSVALTASAITVTNPNNSSGWSTTGSNTLAWQRVSTDPTGFTVLLTNTDRSVLPTNNIVLVDFVDATAQSSIVISGSNFNAGGTYRVNLVQDANDINSIYAQSNDFEITSGSGSASGASTAVVSGEDASTGISPSTSSSSTGSSSASGSNNPTGTILSVTPHASSSGSTTSGSSTSTSSAPASSSNAASSNNAKFELLGVMLALGGFMA